MNNSSKVLKAVFIILLIVTAGELFYFFVYQPSKKAVTTTSKFCPTCQKLVVGPVNKNSAVDSSNVNYLKDLVKNEWKFTLLQEVSGTIANVKIINDNQVTYDLVNDKDVLIEKFVSTIKSSKLPKKIFRQKNENKTFIDDGPELLKLKNGDKVKIARYFDLEKPFSNSLIYNETIIFE